MKIIPVYLPQFHQIPENDEWWGEGFTEWTNVKKAKPLFDGHYQPRIPLNNNYYDLSKVETLKWQCELARKYGIYGFCFYHYWFNGHKLLHKPMEMLLEHPEIDINYCISWANEDWTNQWTTDKNKKTLIQNNFDDEDGWVEHYKYLSQFFKDPRYMKEENKPMMVIYLPHHIKKLKKMLDLWNDMAVEDGFCGLKFTYQNVRSHFDPTMDKSLFDYGVEFHPGYVNFKGTSKLKQQYLMRGRDISHWIYKHFKFKIGTLIEKKQVETVALGDYDQMWEKILALEPDNRNMIPSAFVDWDNTARRQERGSVYLGVTPEKFKGYFKRLVHNTKHKYHQNKIFVFAWNEWAEGGYLEPDEKYGHAYLEAIHDTLKELNELKQDA